MEETISGDTPPISEPSMISSIGSTGGLEDDTHHGDQILRPIMKEASTQTEDEVSPAKATEDRAVQTSGPGHRPQASGLSRPPISPTTAIPGVTKPNSSAHSSAGTHTTSGNSAPDGVAISSAFFPTPRSSQKQDVKNLMRHWNIIRRVGSCCPWHAALGSLLHVVHRLNSKQCNPLWSPYHSFQCEYCLSMNEEQAYNTRQVCAVCKKVGPAKSNHRSSASTETTEETETTATRPPAASPAESTSVNFIKFVQSGKLPEGGPRPVTDLQFAPVAPDAQYHFAKWNPTLLIYCGLHLEEVTRHWNIPLTFDQPPCCSRHVAMFKTFQIAQKLGKMQCEAFMDPLCDGWSCSLCCALNDECDTVCAVCAGPAGPTSSAVAESVLTAPAKLAKGKHTL